ncbi:PadR family transcriptional regulator [Salinactinospora qingdaonensis]|uniref:Transcription regulator PadR N-terminal domain-containing protein n=1 Tax=Salinactinospora qingdaonensis TaxID=702744 RepID=A0ABP7GBV9_9ACTN
MTKDPKGPTTAQFAVLGLVAERPRHGFAIAKLLGPRGEIGRVWSLPPTVIYRALATTTARGLTDVAGFEDSEFGPQRTIYTITAAGNHLLREWLYRPVDHVRDVRVELLLKLALLDRSGEDPVPLLQAQREHLVPVVAGLRQQSAAERSGFDRTLAIWRAESAEAAMRFINRALSEHSC